MRMKAINLYLENHHFIGKWYLLVTQFFKFGLIGALNTFLHFGVYFYLTRFLDTHFLVANAVAFIIAATSSYFLNKFWTFQDKNKSFYTQYPKFIIIAAIGLSMHEALLYLFVNIFHWLDLVALILAAFIVMFWNFFMNRQWTFNNSKNPIGKSGHSNIQKSEAR